jgi:hypothetical protein
MSASDAPLKCACPKSTPGLAELLRGGQTPWSGSSRGIAATRLAECGPVAQALNCQYLTQPDKEGR